MPWKLESLLWNCLKKQLKKWIGALNTQKKEEFKSGPSRVPFVNRVIAVGMRIPTRAGNVLREGERVKDAPFAKFPCIKLDIDEWGGWVVRGNASSHEKCRLPGCGTLNLYSHLTLVDSVGNNTAYHSWCLPSVDWCTLRINSSLGLLKPGMLSYGRKRDRFLP